MQPRSLQYCLSRRTISWKVGGRHGGQAAASRTGNGDEPAFDVGFHLLSEETAQIGGGRLQPGAVGELRDGRAQNFLRDGAGFEGQFPGVAQIERARQSSQ